MVETWRVLGGLTVLLIGYWAGVTVFGAPASVSGFLILAAAGGVGLLAGRLISDRIG